MKKNAKVIKMLVEHYFTNLELGIYYMDLAKQAYEYKMPNLGCYIKDLSDDKLTTHKDLIFNFLIDVDADLDGKLETIKFKKFSSPKDIIDEVYEIEEKIRSVINDISETIHDAHDFETLNFWQWFIKDGLKDFNEVSQIRDLFSLSKDLLSIDHNIKSLMKK